MTQPGQQCFSGLKSFTDTNPFQTRQTLFIKKNEDGSKDVSVFESVLIEGKNELDQFRFVCVTEPVIVRNIDTPVHLMSSLKDKVELVQSVLN